MSLAIHSHLYLAYVTLCNINYRKLYMYTWWLDRPDLECGDGQQFSHSIYLSQQNSFEATMLSWCYPFTERTVTMIPPWTIYIYLPTSPAVFGTHQSPHALSNPVPLHLCVYTYAHSCIPSYVCMYWSYIYTTVPNTYLIRDRTYASRPGNTFV